MVKTVHSSNKLRKCLRKKMTISHQLQREVAVELKSSENLESKSRIQQQINSKLTLRRLVVRLCQFLKREELQEVSQRMTLNL
jgi:hypothetical protein